MRLKTYVCPSMDDALAQIRRDLGPEAVIISSLDEGGKVRVTAACDSPEPIVKEPVPDTRYSSEQVYNHFCRLFAYHGVPDTLRENLLQTIATMPRESVEKGPLSVMESIYNFRTSPFPGTHKGPVLLTGPTGAGKTITLAKLAAEYTLSKKPVTMITTDAQKAGAAEQLLKYSGALKVQAHAVQSGQELLKFVEQTPKDHGLLIDTPGINPFDKGDVQMLADYIFTLKQAPTLVLPAGGDPLEVMDQIEAFKELGVTGFIITRMDTVRRMGALLVAMFHGQLELLGLSAGPTLGHRLIAPSGDKVLNILQGALPKNFEVATSPFLEPAATVHIEKPAKASAAPKKAPLPWIQLLQEKRI